MTSEFVSSEVQEPEGFLEKRKYRVSYQCADCGHQWKSGWRTSVPRKDPPCPNMHCSEMRASRQLAIENARLRQMLAEQSGPAHIGANNTVKAVDETANIVMQDYGMTNLQDGIREGDAVAQKLPVPQQQAADAYFGGMKDSKAVDFVSGRMRTIKAAQLNAIGQRAIKGGYRRLAVAPNAITREPMHSVGQQKNDLYRSR